MTQREARAFAELGRRDGEEAGRSAIRTLGESDIPGRFTTAVEQRLVEFDFIVADARKRGAPADVLEEYQANWRCAFEGQLDQLAAELVMMMPPDEFEDNDG